MYYYIYQKMSSRKLQYSSSINSLVGVPIDFNIIMSQPLKTNKQTIKQIRVISISIPNAIPNISPTNSNNTLRTSKNNGFTWDTINIPVGTYSVGLINSAINSAITSYWSNAGSSGFYMSYNPATNLIFITIDSSKLASASQFCIDFSNNGTSQLYSMLGFNSTYSFNADGVYGASNNAQINWYGNNAICYLSGIGSSISLVNGFPSSELCRISMVQTGNQFIYPLSNYTPYITLDACPSEISSWSVKFVGSSGKPIICTDGDVIVDLELREIFQ
jgi:hypothetical protein